MYCLFSVGRGSFLGSLFELGDVSRDSARAILYISSRAIEPLTLLPHRASYVSFPSAYSASDTKIILYIYLVIGSFKFSSLIIKSYNIGSKIYQALLSRLMEMIHMMLYMEEVSGARWPERIYTRWPARCHVTRRRAQRDCPSSPPYQQYIYRAPNYKL